MLLTLIQKFIEPNFFIEFNKSLNISKTFSKKNFSNWQAVLKILLEIKINASFYFTRTRVTTSISSEAQTKLWIEKQTNGVTQQINSSHKNREDVMINKKNDETF